MAHLDAILFPASPQRAQSMLPVGDGHRLFYQEFGNPQGQPIVYLHGGPGAGAQDYFPRFFDPDAFRIIVYDQRGSGKSTPFMGTKNNTPDLCVADMEKLRDHLGVAQWHVNGGSWGSTLGLLYAEDFPERTLSLTLRGIFLMREQELSGYYRDIKLLYPDEMERLEARIPEEERGDLIRAYFNRISAGDRNAAQAWLRFGNATYQMEMPEKAALEEPADDDSIASTLLEMHFFLNHRFTPDNRILDNAPRIRHIPTHIINGRFDAVCPPANAWDLKRALPEATIEFMKAGHAASEPETAAAIIRATNRIRDFGSPVLR